MRYKRALMGYAALLVLFFHFYVQITTGKTFETFLLRTSYVGVDLFFFLSATSLGKKDKIGWGSFMLNRLELVYLPFVLMAAICAVYKKWTFVRFLQIICGYEFIVRGGGSFLWFAPAIMILYILAPFLLKFKRKIGYWFLPVMLVMWAALCVVVQYVLKQPQLFIILCRVPVFFIGFVYDDFRKLLTDKQRSIIAVILMIGGTVLLYYFGYTKRLNVPFKDFYFVLGIPSVLGYNRLFEFIYSKSKLKLPVLSFLGSFTLDIYGLQMVFGYDIMGKLLKLINQPQLVSLLTCVIIIVIAYVFNRILFYSKTGIKKLVKKNN